MIDPSLALRYSVSSKTDHGIKRNVTVPELDEAEQQHNVKAHVHVRGLPVNTVLPRYRDRPSSANTMSVRTLLCSCVRPHIVDKWFIRVLRYPRCAIFITLSSFQCMQVQRAYNTEGVPPTTYMDDGRL